MRCIKSETICICVLQFSYAQSFGHFRINSLAGELSFVLGVQYYACTQTLHACVNVSGQRKYVVFTSIYM